MSVLIWVQTISKGYQQTSKVAASKESSENSKMSSVANCRSGLKKNYLVKLQILIHMLLANIFLP